MTCVLRLLVLGLALSAAARAQILGTTLRHPNFEGFQQTQAQSLDDYAGRLLLVEFFGHW